MMDYLKEASSVISALCANAKSPFVHQYIDRKSGLHIDRQSGEDGGNFTFFCNPTLKQVDHKNKQMKTHLLGMQYIYSVIFFTNIQI